MNINKAKVITVTSVKGGTGKTTTVLNLAGVYSLKNKKTLIIDLDLYSSAVCTMLDLTYKSDIYKLTDDLSNNRFESMDDYITKYKKNIDVLAAPKDPRISSKVNSHFIPVVISKVILKYDVILIDTNHFLNDINLTAFDCSDKILYVLTNDPVDMKNMKSMVSIFKDMGKTNYYILLNSSTSKGRNKYSKYDIKAFIKHDIDYFISDSFYFRNIDTYIANGRILTLDNKIRTLYKRAISNYEFIANDMILDKENKGE